MIEQNDNIFSSSTNIISFINNMLKESTNLNASDIHIEPKHHQIDIRFRVDGRFVNYKSLPKGVQQQLVTRIKILSGLKIDETRLPQDGKTTYTSDNIVIDMRVSILPVQYGEKIVIRILTKENKKLTFDDLGLIGEKRELIEKCASYTFGIVLVTGPTGSGKSTTLYSLLTNFDASQYNISTLEDPIEYTIDDVNQSQINTMIGFDFPDGLRTLLRQDPDIIMVGEIRDKITGKLAIESALTGHLVFSTLHTNDAPSTIQRLVEMGIENFLITSSVRVIIAQRLVRKVCEFCKVPYYLDDIIKSKVEKELNTDLSKTVFYKSKGCAKCKNLGYKGRIGAFEIMEMTPEIRALTLQRGLSSDVLREQAIKDGMETLLQDGLKKASMGWTSIEEVYRVIGA